MIAEIGGNHEGDFEYAKKLTQLAIESDVDYIKFQIYTGDSLVSEVESPTRNKHFKKFELTQENHIELAEMIKKAGIGYLSSVWDVGSIEWIEPYMDFYKIGSGDLTAYSVLEETAKMGKPIVLSTGLSTEEDVLGAVQTIQDTNEIYRSPENLALLQCTSMYPITFEDAHLNVMDRLKALTSLTVGYSDHTVGLKALEVAIAMGAEILEFHFTDSREGKTFRDHQVSLIPDEVKQLVSSSKEIMALKGKPTKHPLKIETDNDHVTSFRRAVYINKDVPEGHIVSAEDFSFLRPNHGIDAREYKRLIGKTTTRPVKKHEALNWNQFQ